MATWLLYQWGRAVYAFDHDGGTWVQAIAAITNTAITFVLAFITYKSLRATNHAVDAAQEQAKQSAAQVEESRRQLRLIAYPNFVVTITNSAYRMDYISVGFENKGVYPLLISNARITVTHGGKQEVTPLDWRMTVASGEKRIESAPLGEVVQKGGLMKVNFQCECSDIFHLETVSYSETNEYTFGSIAI